MPLTAVGTNSSPDSAAAGHPMKRRWLTYLLLLLLLGLQYRLWVGQGSWEEVAATRRAIEQQKFDNAEMRARNERLYGEIDSLRHDLDSVEDRARSELGLVRDGETFYLIIEE